MSKSKSPSKIMTKLPISIVNQIINMDPCGPGSELNKAMYKSNKK
jgi:hypothetical protein